MTDRIVFTDASGAVGIVTCAEYPDGFYGPLPPDDPDHRAIYDRLVADGVRTDPYVAPAPPPRAASGRQIRYALNKLQVRVAWDEAVAGRPAAGKPDDADYWATLGSGDLAPETSPKLVRIATAASPPVDLKALYDAALSL